MGVTEAPGLAGIHGRKLARRHQAKVAGGACRPFEARVVDDERDAVGGQLDVHLDPGQARFQRGGEGRKRVLREIGGVAAMRYDPGQQRPGRRQRPGRFLPALSHASL